jgi:hypothetical protein
MKRFSSQESNALLLSSSSQRSQSRISRRILEQNTQSKARPLAPKQEDHDSYSTKAKRPKIVEFILDDTIRQKAEIPYTSRQQPQRKTVFCAICEDHPQGFHGEHELRRHIERHHTGYRKVWICKENTSKDGPRPCVSLSSCKACRNNKTYGANYNAAAHLRRAHFFPNKNKRGGRGKVSEGRGGMGGGDEPPMDELKNWMYEKVEVNVAGNVPQSTHPELSQIDNDMFTEFNQFDDAIPYNHGRNVTETTDRMEGLLADAPPETREAPKQDRMEMMLIYSLTLRGYYAVMREISGTYAEVSKKYIMPGVNQVDQLSLTDSSTVSQVQIEAKTKQIAAFAETAQQKINELANKVRVWPPFSSAACHWKLNNVTDSIVLFSASSFLPINW